ncbi:hypothetical protein MVEN_02541300 [Mycena venus]|uniref:Uncharacterized protein n=1 Tax=Mycena venus TaxID=2733690 RepID=A0A8H6U467_9AGAR|nr:hypothetical protein MVEN_02541300 [Mycena venus]
MRSLSMICLCSLFSTPFAMVRPRPSQCSVPALGRVYNICHQEDDATALELSSPVDVPTTSSPAVDGGLAESPIENEILCPPVPAGYVPVSLADLEEAARLGELLASEYAEEYTKDSPGVLPS